MTDAPVPTYTHDKGRDCRRTDDVLDAYRRRAIAAEQRLADIRRYLYAEIARATDQARADCAPIPAHLIRYSELIDLATR